MVSLDTFVNVRQSQSVVDITTMISQSNLCIDLNCVVISINYRHAPENRYPIAIDDSFAGLKWVLTPETVTRLSIDTSKMAVGGLSAYARSSYLLETKG
jgi:hypothetical protein